MEKKIFEMTGSPKPHFEKKDIFVEIMKQFGWEHGKMTKRNNVCNILVCETTDSGSAKLKLASELGVEVMTYEEIVDVFGI